MSGEQEPWQWPEETWRRIVGQVRAGRSLKPKRWKGDNSARFRRRLLGQSTRQPARFASEGRVPA
jgi:hypothetical protein